MQIRSPIATFGQLTTLVCCSGSTGTETKVPQSAEPAAQVERPQEVAEDIEPYESILTVRVSDAFARKMMRRSSRLHSRHLRGTRCRPE